MTKNKILTVLAAWGLCIMMPVSILASDTSPKEITSTEIADIVALAEFQGAEADGNNISEAIQGLITGEKGYKYPDGMLLGISSAAYDAGSRNDIEPDDTETVGSTFPMSGLLNITGGALTKSDTPVNLGALTITISE